MHHPAQQKEQPEETEEESVQETDGELRKRMKHAMTCSKWIRNDTSRPVEVWWRSVRQEVFGVYVLHPGDSLEREDRYPWSDVLEVCVKDMAERNRFWKWQPLQDGKHSLTASNQFIHVSEVIQWGLKSEEYVRSDEDETERFPQRTQEQEECQMHNWIYNDILRPVQVWWRSVHGEVFAETVLKPGRTLTQRKPLTNVDEVCIKIKSTTDKQCRAMWKPQPNRKDSLALVSDILAPNAFDLPQRLRKAMEEQEHKKGQEGRSALENGLHGRYHHWNVQPPSDMSSKSLGETDSLGSSGDFQGSTKSGNEDHLEGVIDSATVLCGAHILRFQLLVQISDSERYAWYSNSAVSRKSPDRLIVV
eukprot:gnl/MRDRNA2_/MRDRNA2_27393_c0_seq2.p1 gnl/MRDRNA2_/MRDRNA2_27393_c0~~gnl/MRDRNA2_/MRDRNA2_27393_c0_seq2.p1  ORF type:complete len:362 (+),score=60.90 gnl/MRDRNA2_/MRDRNA2_27393_c0_seq2:194-1279(+)